VVGSILLATVLFGIWIVSLYLLVLDDISLGAKFLWFIVLTVLAPISVPVYFVLRHRRHAQRVTTAPAD
jgi:hypothetical protein